MKLKSLLKELDYEVINGDIDIEIKNINYDSRKVSANDLFVCIKGLKVNGHNYAESAIKGGAIAIICEDNIEGYNNETVIIKVKNTRKALAKCAANFYENPSKKMSMIGVTGTNGKTTTAFMIKEILEKAGKKVGLIGTISNFIGSEKIYTERTTPESLELQELFKEMVEKDCEYCVMEVSSHSLALDRVYGVEFEVGIFTNLTRDHLDFHKNFKNYFESKALLFERSKISIVNIDDEYGVKLKERLNKTKVITYAIKNTSDYTASDEKCESTHIGYKLKYSNKEENFQVGLPGKFNIYNSLGAIAACINLNIDMKFIKEGISDVVVLGRCEMVGKKYNLPYTIILDYAHTPDGLQNILETARGFTKNRLILVFGCGGDRDKVKRPQMGKIGTDLSDIAVVTSDNPRSEEPAKIIEEIISGVEKKNYITIENRKEGIRKSIEIARPGDVIVIAGKGHEDYQILNTGKIHFNEREIVEEILQSI